MHSIQTIVYLGLVWPPQMHSLVTVQDSMRTRPHMRTAAVGMRKEHGPSPQTTWAQSLPNV